MTAVWLRTEPSDRRREGAVCHCLPHSGRHRHRTIPDTRTREMAADYCQYGLNLFVFVYCFLTLNLVWLVLFWDLFFGINLKHPCCIIHVVACVGGQNVWMVSPSTPSAGWQWPTIPTFPRHSVDIWMGSWQAQNLDPDLKHRGSVEWPAVVCIDVFPMVAARGERFSTHEARRWLLSDGRVPPSDSRTVVRHPQSSDGQPLTQAFSHTYLAIFMEN